MWPEARLGLACSAGTACTMAALRSEGTCSSSRLEHASKPLQDAASSTSGHGSHVALLRSEGLTAAKDH